MLIYVLSAVILLFILINWYLSVSLYEEPSDPNYFNNVNRFPGSANVKHINANPRYVLIISIFVGIVIGIYYAYASIEGINFLVKFALIFIILVCYLIEITRSITLKDGVLIFSKFLYKTKEIHANMVKGMYIYSYNKKFLKKNAYTTKIVVITKDEKKYKFSLSSLDNRAVLSMMKEEFGVVNNKMFISKREEKK